MESLVVGTLALFGMVAGRLPIVDNSTFVHLRTGIEIARGHGIPRVDPYSFTASGHHWVVQSWLPSWTYGVLAHHLGLGWVALEQGVLVAAVAWLVARLARTGSAVRTVAAAGIAVGAGAAYWAPRPLLFGLLAFVLTITVVERRANPLWLVPVVWFWVNSHGSFPLGGLWLGAAAVGDALDRRARPLGSARYIGAFLLGMLVAAVNPLGPRLLWFPFAVGDRRNVFRSVVEWQSPDFQSRAGIFTLVFVVLGLVVLLRRRVPWRDVLPVVVFLAIGLLAMRNLASMAVVFAPALGRALRVDADATTARPLPLNTVIAGLLTVVFVMLGVSAAAGPGIRTTVYPVAATTWLDRHGYVGGARRVATQDAVGCYLILRYGTRAHVFIDDRVDMYPVPVSEDYATLLKGKPGARRVLDRRGVDAVLWQRD
ncbi:MAG: hypothetical protein H0W70_00595, partial [Actinobacteria bacterium]|nr:hypothetical protein [Actinomycetota bacterium]